MQTQQATRAPSTPSPTATPTITIQDAPGLGTFTITTPMTAREFEAIKERRSELSDQLVSVDGRRSKLIAQMKSTGDPVAIKGLEDRLALLDKRQLQLETDIAQTGQQVSSAPAGVIATSEAPVLAGLGSGQVVAISIVTVIFVLAPLAMGVARTIWRRSVKPAVPPAAVAETAQRLERLESSIDAIAVEIERISEGQRFVTRLLSEGQPVPSLGAGQRAPDPVRSGQ